MAPRTRKADSSKDADRGQEPAEVPSSGARRGHSAESRSDSSRSGTSSRGTAAASGAGAGAGAGERGVTIVVGIGASAGGLADFERLLEHLPSDTGMAFVLVQHLDPERESVRSELLSRSTPMPVVPVTVPTAIEANKIYVIPPNEYIHLKGDGLTLTPTPKKRRLRMPIDSFFGTLAKARGERGAGIVLSGTGTDGAQGLKEVEAAGGLAIAQRPESAEYAGRPHARAGGAADFVLPIEEIPAALLSYARHPYARPAAGADRLGDESPALLKVLELLRSHTGYDFRCYKSGTLSRRIHRRMSLRQVDSLGEYIDVLKGNVGEVEAMYRDLLVGVTSFFRDEEAWEVFENDVIEKLVERKVGRESLRAWVPGCATGEEAYSLAIALSDAYARRDATPDVLIFATDVNDDSIRRARAGAYSANITADVPPARLRRHFLEDGRRFRVAQPLRELLILATQNLVTEPPFSNLDILSCRNVLIYLEPDVQRRLVRLFHFALRDGGYLFLGPSESVPDGDGLFSPISSKWRVYRKLARAGLSGRAFPVLAVTAVARDAKRKLQDEESARSREAVDSARDTLLASFAPPSVLVDRDHAVHYFHGPLGEYLSMPPGQPTRHLPTLVREELGIKLRRLLRDVSKHRKAATAVVSRTEPGGRGDVVRLRVSPVDRHGIDWYVVSFERESQRDPEVEADAAADADAGVPLAPEKARASGSKAARELRRELDAMREDLQSTREDLEVSNDELESKNERIVSMNEQLQSMNEEFQSTHEEMETSREKLQSLNEELSTVNTELQEKVAELEATNDDLSNLLVSTEIAVIFLDTELRVRRFTPACAELLRVIPSDVGRPISDLSVRVNDPDLLDHAEAVLRKLDPMETQIRRDGQHFMRRILPFRTSEGAIDGVVVTFTEITQLERAHRKAEVRERQQEVVAKLGQLALAGSERESLFDETVRAVAETLDVPFAKLLELDETRAFFHLVAGVGWEPGLVGEARVEAGARSQAGFTLQSGSPVVVADLAEERRFVASRLLTEHRVTSGMSIAVGPSDDPWGVLGAHTAERREFTVDDVNFLQTAAHVLTEAIRRRESEKEAADRERRMSLITDAIPVLLSYCDDNRVYRFCNRNYQRWFGLEQDQILGRSVLEVIGVDAYEHVKDHLDRVLAGEPVSFDAKLAYRHGSPRSVHVNYIPHYGDGDRVVGYYAMIEDVSDRVQADLARARLAAIVEQSTDAIFTLRLDGRITDCNRAAERMFGRPKDEIVGGTLSSLHLGDAATMQGAVDRALEGEPVESFEVTYRRASGPPLDLSMAISATRDPAGEVTGTSVIARDVTPRKQAERALKGWADRLEERVAERTAVAEKRAADLRALTLELTRADQRARKRLAKEMHDNLQQTLVAAKMRADTGNEGVHGPDAEGRAEQGWSEVSGLLDQALDASRALVSELSPPVLQAGSIADILTWLARHMRKRHELEVRIEVKGNAPRELDERVKTLVLEVVRELLFNVVKHAGTKAATVSLSAEAEQIHVRVSDAGKGFEEKDAVERSQGFGLFSVRERVAGFGGAFTLDTAPGRGSTVLVRLPIPRVERSRKRRPVREARRAALKNDRPSGGSVRILLVDDHKIMREGLLRILSSEPGLEVVAEASDGEDAVEKAAKLRPDVVVMDITMPKLNGIEATREIMERHPDTIVIGLSLHDDEDVAATIRQAGAAAYLQKDTASTTLIQAIREHCSLANDRA